MKQVGTHDSLTSYPLKLWWQRLLSPIVLAVSRTQTKTIREQYAAGCRSYDFRFAKVGTTWYAAHGSAVFNVTFGSAMAELNRLPGPVYVRIVAEDSFIKCDVDELADIVHMWFLSRPETKVKLILVTSKSNWRYRANCPTWEATTVNYDLNPITENDRDSLCEKVAGMYEQVTSENMINFVGCYESGGIPIRLLGRQPIVFGYPLQVPYPKLAAKALTKIALRKKWRDNDIPIIDFL